VVGPALIEEPESTCLLDAGDAGRIDAEGNLVAEIGVAEIGVAEIGSRA
jgi:hypothetical protein